MKKIVITGSGGLLGWHCAVRLYAENCAANFKNAPPPYQLVQLDHPRFGDPTTLSRALNGADIVFHFAGVNRGPDDDVEQGNIAIATTLADGLRELKDPPVIVYANSTHSGRPTPYGRSKQKGLEILSGVSDQIINLVLPHIFGEGARPFYNNVTATLIHHLHAGTAPEINPTGEVQLLHAGAAVQYGIDAALSGRHGEVTPEFTPYKIQTLYDKLRTFHEDYSNHIFPDTTDPFDVALFNTYRCAGYPDGFPKQFIQHSDDRGSLFEACKARGGGGQGFFSWTEPGITRGDHFHLNKIERFAVLQGTATIRVRQALNSKVWEYQVSGDKPCAVDMPTLHSHNIQNTGDEPMLCYFWTHDLFDPQNPDTFFDPVQRKKVAA